MEEESYVQHPIYAKSQRLIFEFIIISRKLKEIAQLFDEIIEEESKNLKKENVECGKQ